VKLVIAIVHDDDAPVLLDALLERDLRATRLQSMGGYLRRDNATILVGVEDRDVEKVLHVIRESSRSRTELLSPLPPLMDPGELFMPFPVEVEVGGATVFVVPVERFERL
jgi:uncharacterized protein YaaQ